MNKVTEECDVCGRAAPNCGPFRADDGRSWALVCGGCKVRISMTPERKQRLAAELQAAFDDT